MNAMRELKNTIWERVRDAVARGQDINLGPVHRRVQDHGAFCWVEGFGRVDKPTDVYRPVELRQLYAEVLGAIRASFETPQKALEAILIRKGEPWQ